MWEWEVRRKEGIYRMEEQGLVTQIIFVMGSNPRPISYKDSKHIA